MSNHVMIALVGDYDTTVTAHSAIPNALAVAGEAAGCTVEHSWIATDTLGNNIAERLSWFDGLWCVPGSPYTSIEGALAAIQYAREQGRPFLGTCGGFQHAILEYARNVLGYTDADNAESNPDTAMPLIAPLSCSLVGANGTVAFRPNSRISEIYGIDKAEEQYNCSYGFNPRYLPLLSGSHLLATGVGRENEPRVVELERHPFFVATLFQPERSALTGTVHPVIKAYVQAACRYKATSAVPNKLERH